MNQVPDTAGYLHQEVLKKARYLVITVDKYGLVAKQECPGIQWRFDSIRTGRMLPDALQGVLDSCTDSSAPQLFPYVQLSDELVADIHVLNRDEDRQIILQDVSHGHDDEHRLQQKAHEVSLLLERQAQLNQLLEEKRQEAEQASQAKSRFIAAMSHEFRSPISSIMAHSESLSDRLPGETEPVAIQRATWYLLALVENLLEQARMGEGNRRLDLLPVEANRVISDMGSLFLAQAAAADLDLNISKSADNCLVLADELRLRQVLINLVSNALRCTQAGSVTIAVQGEGLEARFSVRDTGVGIAESDIESIFLPFRQLDSGSKGGAGLGLTISNQLVRDMGGKLDVRSTEGEGSEFSFTLPMAAEATAEDSLEGRNVLLLEDDEDISSIFQIWLKDWGCAVVPASNCEQARARFREAEPDLVLSDLFLEDGNGAELLRELRESSPGLAAVLCSGSEAGLLEQPGDKREATVLISKPVSATRLRAALQAAVRLAEPS